MPDCLFCKIAAHEIPVTALHEDEQSLAFADIAPQAPTHLLIIPKSHYTYVYEAQAELLGHLLHIAGSLGRGHMPGGFRVVLNTGVDGGQTVQHLHLHVLGGRSMRWPPG